MQADSLPAELPGKPKENIIEEIILKNFPEVNKQDSRGAMKDKWKKDPQLERNTLIKHHKTNDKKSSIKYSRGKGILVAKKENQTTFEILIRYIR